MPILPLLLAAAALPLTPLPDARVGPVNGTRAFVAVSLDQGRVRVYVCDGTVRRDPTVSAWFTGRWNGRARLTLKAGGHTLTLRGTTGSFDGHAFRLRRAKPPAGLWDGRHGKERATWIVDNAGRIRGAMVSPRPRKCRPVLVTSSNGTQQYVTVCS